MINQIIYSLPNSVEYYYYGTHGGAECDLVLVHGATVLCCVEIKLSKAPTANRGFYQSVIDLQSSNNFIVGLTEYDYTHKNGHIVTGLKKILTHNLPNVLKSYSLSVE